MKKKASIKRKITLRIVLIGVATFALSLVLSYVVIIPGLRDDAIGTAEKANTEIIQQFDNLASYVEDYTENIALSAEQNQKMIDYFADPNEQNLNRAALDLNNLVSHEGFVRCVIIEDQDGVMLDSLNKITEEDYEIIDSDWYRHLNSMDYSRGFSPVYQINWNNRTIYTAAYLKKFFVLNRWYTFTVFFDMNDVIYDSGVVAGNTLDDYMMVDSTGHVFYATGTEEWVQSMIQYIDMSWERGQMFQEADGGIELKKVSINTKWQIISYVSEQTIFASFQSNVISIVVIMSVFLIITLGFLPKSLSGIVEPIGTLSKAMSTAESNNWGTQVDITSNDEIGDLSLSFNKMLDDLKCSIKVIAEKEKLEQKIKYSLLVSQINPHFIYNTLNSINYLARQKRTGDITVVNTALITILQDRLRVGDIGITDTLENEIRVVEQYLSIQRYTYGGDLEVLWDVDEGLMGEQVPKNMIQPLVENSIFHGLVDEETGEIKGHINIMARRDGRNIAICVSDDGCGIEPEKLEQLQQRTLSLQSYERGKNIGLSNIRGRLFYLYGTADGMSIESKPGAGTRITLTFRVDEGKEPNDI